MQIVVRGELFRIGLPLNSKEVGAIAIPEAIALSLELPLGAMASLPVGSKSLLERLGCRHVQGGQHDHRTNNGMWFHSPGLPSLWSGRKVASDYVELAQKPSKTATGVKVPTGRARKADPC